MVDELLSNVLHVNIFSKNHENKFEFSYEMRCTVVHGPLNLMETCFFAISMDIYHELSEYP